MAERRMLSKRVTDTDDFLDMPLSAQALYMHINMHADDDGFVSNVKTIIRMVGAREDDLKLLIAKRFIFSFESGVVVIRNWFIHNYIRKDRYHETLYADEKSQLSVDETGSYQLGIPAVDQRLTEVRLGKDRIGEDKLEIEPETDTKQKSYSHIVAMFENNGFGSVGGILSQNISDELKDFAAESNYSEATKVISKAIEIAVNQGNNRPAYVWGITKNWYQRKLFTLASVEAVENKRKKDTATSEAKKQSDAEKQQVVKEKELLAHRQEQYEKVLSIYSDKFGFVRTPVFLQDTPDLKNNDVWELLVAGDDKTYERLKQVVDSHE
ncbi:DnaD domain protein [Leuconostoc falkenbergense]|uniref:DnaD domain protein n=1 Tax=Leuconostoc falkenbergense TaxID=2766470 RepID=UPI0024A8AD79|nr:DnaD domain protein [Leuconostoc falkenbergense]MDI6553123.1 DnaD domain protein [Leuconostoc falkenbergense]